LPITPEAVISILLDTAVPQGVSFQPMNILQLSNPSLIAETALFMSERLAPHSVPVVPSALTYASFAN
jgi:hypothetical protein